MHILLRLFTLAAFILALSLGGLLTEVAIGRPLDYSISDAKKLFSDGDQNSVYMVGKPITYSANGVVYIEDRENECCGIRIQNAGPQPGPGNKLDVWGYMRTNEYGERYVDATSAYATQGGSAPPLAMTAKCIGGGDWFYESPDTKGQRGVFQGVGLNNVGLLVKVYGHCVKLNDTTFTLNDGSGTIRCIIENGNAACENWQYVVVTGISSILNYDGQNRSVVLVRSVDVIAPVEVVSTPGNASGQTQLLINVPITYTTTGAVCNLCHEVEYSFDWGDGTTSGWTTQTSVSHAWATLGQRLIKITARCSVHNNVTRASDALIVNVNQFQWQQANGPTGYMMCFAFNSANTLFAGSWGSGIFRTLNEGQSWQQISSGLGNGNIWTLMASSMLGKIFAGTYGSGIYRSSNNGDSWQPSSTGLSNGYINAIVGDNSGILYVATLNGVHKSTNGGDYWSYTWSGNPNVYALAWDQQNSILYAGTYGSGVYRSQNGGSSWTAVNNGLANPYVNALAIDSQGNIYCGTQGNGIYRSTNHGDTWQYRYSGSAYPYVQSITITKDDHVYATTLGYGVYRSVDNGLSWQQIINGLGNTNVYEVKISSTGHIFAATYGSGVYKGVYSVSE